LVVAYIAVPLHERKYRTYLNYLGDEFHFYLNALLYRELRLNMPTFIELITTENKIEIRNVSMFIMKSFEIRKTHTLF